MEIERKYLILTERMSLSRIEEYPCHNLEQAYLCTSPVLRVRREDDRYYMTYKNGGTLAHEEYNLPLDKDSYEHLLAKADGNIICKRRYLIPLSERLTAEVDVFGGAFDGLVFAEVEFDTVEEAEQFIKPDWFGEEVTYDRHYHNSYMSSHAWFTKE